MNPVLCHYQKEKSMSESKNSPIQIALPCFGPEEQHAVLEPLKEGWVTQGPRVKKFESDFSEYHGCSHALATTSCTTALHLGLLALGVGQGDEVIIPAFTWVASANVVVYCGATPIMVDVHPRTYNIDIDQLASKISSKTKAIIPVHLFGLMSDIHAIRAIVGPDIAILEDAACASGAKLGEAYAGVLGDAAAFSFHPRKIISTGEGGMLTCKDEKTWQSAEILRNHGATISEEVRHRGARPFDLPEFNCLGFNYRMTDMQAAIGIEQLKKLTQFIVERRQWADFYQASFQSLSWLKTPIEPKGYQHAWQAYVCCIDPNEAPVSRDDMMLALQEQGIATRPGTHAVHELGYYRNAYETQLEDCPNASFLARQTIALPLHNCMSESDFHRVANAVMALNACYA